MAPPRRQLALCVAALALLPALMPPAAAAGPLEESHAVPLPVASLDLPVAVVLSGFTLTPAEQDALRGAVGATWAPFVVPTGLPIGVAYNVTLRFIETSSAFDSALAQTLDDSLANDTLGRFVGNYPGLLDNLTTAFPSIQQTTPLPHASADTVLSWLAGADSAFPEIAPSVGEVRLFFLNPSTVPVPYYYRVDSSDVDSGQALTFETANAWGGTDGIFFQDLRAAPGHLGEGSGPGRPADFAGEPPLWSYGSSSSERARLVADLATYVNGSVRILAAPAYAVTPYLPSALNFNVTLFDDTQSQDLFTAGGAGAPFGINSSADLLDPAVVEGAVSELMPAAPITVTVRTANKTSDPDIASAVTGHTTLGAGGERLVDPFGVNTDLRARFAVPDQPILPGDNVSLPAVLAVLDGEAYVQSTGTRGATLQRSDGRAASIIIAAGLDQLGQRRLTETLVHEAGHALGLSHPHEIAPPGSTSNADLIVDWLRDMSSTPMTYLPAYADYTFDSFDKHAVASGMASTTLAAAYLARQQAWAALDARGYSDVDVPASFNMSESLFLSFAEQARAAMAAANFYTPAGVSSPASGAAVLAKRAYDEAKDMLISAVLLPRCCDTGGHSFPSPGPDAPLAVAAVAVAAAALARRARRRRQ